MSRSGSVSVRHLARLRQGGLLARTLGRLLRDRGGSFGLVVTIGVVALGVSAPWIAPYDPFQIGAGVALAPPSSAHLLGTDDLSRDVLSRVLFGAQISVTVSFASAGVAVLVAVPLGLLAGYLGGWVDAVIGRVFDTIFAFPAILVGSALVAALGSSLTNVVIAVAIISVPTLGRLTRVGVLAQRVQEYVVAARALGASELRIASRHIVPNIVPPLLVQTTLVMADAVLLEGAFSFLGLGSRPPTPSWGTMLSEGRNFLSQAPWLGIFPGLLIALMIMGLNALGDGLRVALNPRE